jgi:hypothetical protein
MFSLKFSSRGAATPNEPVRGIVDVELFAFCPCSHQDPDQPKSPSETVYASIAAVVIIDLHKIHEVYYYCLIVDMGHHPCPLGWKSSKKK